MHFILYYSVSESVSVSRDDCRFRNRSLFPKLTYFIFHLFLRHTPGYTLVISFSVLSKCPAEWLAKSGTDTEAETCCGHLALIRKCSISDSGSVLNWLFPLLFHSFSSFFGFSTQFLERKSGRGRITESSNTIQNSFLLFRPIFWFLVFYRRQSGCSPVFQFTIGIVTDKYLLHAFV